MPAVGEDGLEVADRLHLALLKVEAPQGEEFAQGLGVPHAGPTRYRV